MATVERNPLIRMAFTHLSWALSYRQTTYDELRDPGLTDLSEIHSSLLPLLQKQIKELVLSFEVIDFENGPVPELHLFPKVAALQHTWEKTMLAVVSVALRPDQPDFTQDHDCKDLKKFRCARLLNDVDDLPSIHFGFLQCCVELLEGAAVDQPTQETVPEINEEFRESPKDEEDWQSTKKREMSHGMTQCLNAIEGIIQRIKRSDLGLLQEKWQEWIGSTSEIGSISHVISLFYSLYHESTPDGPRNLKLIPLMQSAKAVYVVFRVFYKKLSDVSTNKLPFALRNVSSDEMDLILYKTAPPGDLHGDFVDLITSVFYQDAIEGFQQGILEYIAPVLRRDFGEALDCLKSYLIPFPHAHPGDLDSPPSFDFDTYFLDLKNQLNVTLDNFVNISNGLEPIDHLR